MSRHRFRAQRHARVRDSSALGDRQRREPLQSSFVVPLGAAGKPVLADRAAGSLDLEAPPFMGGGITGKIRSEGEAG
jgi:hypothetical protein